MKINLFNDLIDRQLEFLLPRSLIADAILFIISLPFYGLDTSVPSGLLIGTAAMLVNMVLLGISVGKCTDCPTAKSAKRCMFKYYMLRLVIVGAAVLTGFKVSGISPIACCIPLFYPKLFYTASGIFRKKDKG